MQDYAIWAQDYGKIGNSQSDLASTDPNGTMYIGTRPDNIVDYHDMKAFFQLMITDEKRRGTYDPNNWEEQE